MSQPELQLEYRGGADREDAGRVGLRPLMRSIGSVAGALIGLILVLAIFGAWSPRLFLRADTFVNVLKYNYAYAVAAVGATFVIITAGIDLSVASVMALAGVACAMAVTGVTIPEFDVGQMIVISLGVALTCGLCTAGFLLQRGTSRTKSVAVGSAAAIAGAVVSGLLWWLIAGRKVAPMPVWAGVSIGIATGGLVGLFNGLLITSLSLPPFIVTLGTLGGVRGLVLYMTGSMPVDGLPDALLRMHSASWLGLPPNVWITVVLILIAAPVLHFSVMGRYVYAIGSNERTARLCGVSVERWKTICYVVAGLTAGLAGVMMDSRLHSAIPSEYQGWELTIIAAVVIGGTSLFGGEGTMIGSIIGVLMIGFLRSGCNLAGVEANLQQVFIGAIIVLAAAVDRFRHLSG